MTDKQIIINGVDVSGCKKYEHEIVRCNATLKNMCFCGGRCTDKKNADCYFKQLKRKEQECERLKNELSTYGATGICETCTEKYVLKCDQLEKENEKLKKANKHIEYNRNQKADKLMRIEKLIIACSTGYTDEFIQELLVILHEPEPNSFENKYKATLA